LRKVCDRSALRIQFQQETLIKICMSRSKECRRCFRYDERPDSPEPSHTAVHHDTCLYFGCPDPDAAYQYLKTKGIGLEPPVNAYYGMRQLYFHDPDGYSLCFQWPIDSAR
jgi:hypothetical protein